MKLAMLPKLPRLWRLNERRENWNTVRDSIVPSEVFDLTGYNADLTVAKLTGHCRLCTGNYGTRLAEDI